jgi:hypothetical protein
VSGRADVGGLTWKVYPFEVLKNGKLRGMNGPAGMWGSAAELFDTPLAGPYSPFGDFGPLCGPNHPQNAGKRTWLVRANFHTHHSKTDPVAFVGTSTLSRPSTVTDQASSEPECSTSGGVRRRTCSSGAGDG